MFTSLLLLLLTIEIKLLIIYLKYLHKQVTPHQPRPTLLGRGISHVRTVNSQGLVHGAVISNYAQVIRGTSWSPGVHIHGW
jgi:hypothetical protein